MSIFHYCSNCGGHQTEILRDAEYTLNNFSRTGPRSVTMQGIEILACEDCGNNDPLIPALKHLVELLNAHQDAFMATVEWRLDTREWKLISTSPA